MRLRQLAWELEKTGTDLCLAPALLDVAGPRTTIRPTAGLTLLHVDHPQLSGPLQIMKDLFDRCAAGFALALLAPVMLFIALAIRFSDGGPALFRQTRVGKDGGTFQMYKFRTMVVDAEQRLAELQERNDLDGVLFKMRRIPASPRSGPGCASGRLTSCRSSSTSCSARCRSSARGRRCPPRRSGTPTTFAVGSWCGQG